MSRPYKQLVEILAEPAGDRTTWMRTVVDRLWDALHPTGVSWVGFYVHEGRDDLILGPHRDKPACSPILLHGACGQAFMSRKPLVIRDVAELGENYIACDANDRSEVVVPLFDEAGVCWGVLDLDSYDVGSFDDGDIEGLESVLQAAGLTAAPKA